MNLAIQIKVAIKSLDDYSDWLAGQNSIMSETRFIFSFYEKDFAFAHYATDVNPKDVLPALPRGSKFVWINC